MLTETRLCRLRREVPGGLPGAQARARAAPALLAVALLAGGVAGCVGPAAQRPAAPAGAVASTAPLPAASPEPAGGAQWTISGADSLITIEVLRGGPMAKLGHNHVIAARGIEGTLQLREPLENSTFELRLAVAQFTVDEPELRALAGADFSAPVPDSARAGTRANMLGSGLLDAQHYPEILLQSQSIRRDGAGFIADVRVTLRGNQRLLTLPLSLRRETGGLTVSGELTLRQSQLGLAPFSVMMGALQVQDAIRLRFRIVARPYKVH